MININKLIEQKKIENEFQNKEPTKQSGEGIVSHQHLINELAHLNKKRKTFDFQAEQLHLRLRKLQKEYFDDMTIFDLNSTSHDINLAPWKSKSEHTRNKYSAWNITAPYVKVRSTPQITEVAIRREGYEKQIVILHKICRRIQDLNDMAKTVSARQRDIKKELSDDHKISLSSVNQRDIELGS